MSQNLHRPRSRFGGFTLPELLIAILIISILAILGMAVMKQAMQIAKRTTCMSNERGLYKVLNLYSADHGGQYPVGYDSKEGAWTGKIYPYISPQKLEKQTTGIIYCPLTKVGDPTYPRDANQWRTDYNLNGNIVTNTPGKNPVILSPKLLLLYDGKGSTRASAADSKYIARHGGFMNVTFADGHIESLSSFDGYVDA